MKVEIFNVGHGGCALITTNYNQHILIDCGHRTGALQAPTRNGLLGSIFDLPPITPNGLGALSNAFSLPALNSPTNFSNEWRPSTELMQRGIDTIDLLVVSNYDADHVSDFDNILGKIFIADIVGNPSVSMPALRGIKRKTGGVGNGGLSSLIDFMEYGRHTLRPRQIPGIYIYCFWVIYNPAGSVTSTNNLSLVTFVSCDNLHMIFPGDIEAPAWRLLLRDASFLAHLKRVNVFVTSHHGREPGYFGDVFANGRCSPVAAVISDKSIMHGTQESAASRYGRHVEGFELGGRLRSVLTTRDDGKITFIARPNDVALVRLGRAA